MRTARLASVRSLLVLLLVLPIVPPVHAGEDGRDMAWSGYLFRDGEGRVRLGWPVIAMGVEAQPAHLVASPAADRLAPLVTDLREDYSFWNYALEGVREGPVTGVPRVLVRLRGRVTRDVPARDFEWSSAGTVTMHDAELLAAEFLDETWLRRWAAVFRDPASPFRIALDRGEIGAEERAAFARRAFGILESLRAVPPPSARDAERLRAIAPDARLVGTHRQQSEWSIQRWLTEFVAQTGLAIPGLEALPPLPPSIVELQRWFLDAATKAAFLARVAEAWTGDLAMLDLYHYVESGSSISMESADVARVRDAWSEADYVARRAATARMIGR